MVRRGAVLIGSLLFWAASLIAPPTAAFPPSVPRVVPDDAYEIVTITAEPETLIWPDADRAGFPTRSFAGSSPAPAPTPRVPTVADAKAYVFKRLGTTQGTCLVNIVNHEDGTWDPFRWNEAGSGAYGLPQALPGSYVNNRYGSACDAWRYWQDHHWY